MKQMKDKFVEERGIEVKEEKKTFNTVLQNIRKEPKGLIIGTCPIGEIEVINEEGAWAQISAGYIESKFLEEK